jgi:hypothetical protein
LIMRLLSALLGFDDGPADRNETTDSRIRATRARVRRSG